MKVYKIPLILLLLLLAFSCNTENDGNTSTSNLAAVDMANISYGTDAQQKIDVYLPANRTTDTKVFILVHGGAWSGGSKADMAAFVPLLKLQFPDYAIVNLEYRLATLESPGFPKQIQDIQKMVQFVKNSDYHISSNYAFIGASAGAHLSMLYSYKYDADENVKAVASIVGPTDFTDPAYTENASFQFGLTYLIGPIDYHQNPAPFIEVSPATHVNAQSPPTVMFYGGMDPLVPASQGPRLKAKLDNAGVYNEFYLYPNGGHGDWDAVTMIDFQSKLAAFLRTHF